VAATRRQERARQQREEALGVARRLFLERGYVATTVESIATSAVDRMSDARMGPRSERKPTAARLVVVSLTGPSCPFATRTVPAPPPEAAWHVAAALIG
jgi:hypothetical protein